MTSQESEAAEIRLAMVTVALEEVGPIETARFYWGDRGAATAAQIQEAFHDHNCDLEGCA